MAATAVLSFPCRASRRGDPPAWGLSRSQVDRWLEVFSGLDVLAEARKAEAWLQANPGRWKTHRGMARFLLAWLDDLGQEESAAPITAAFLVGLLDEREDERLAFATNVSEGELGLRYGVPLVSRLLAGAEVPALWGIDFRRYWKEAV
ncbi:MAG TPA: hypothetical protein VGS22_01320 [Thermoanaerobaculia bacterium]|nr:hypothetical protein [Thermoanaerobaculia bacterium]